MKSSKQLENRRRVTSPSKELRSNFLLEGRLTRARRLHGFKASPSYLSLALGVLAVMAPTGVTAQDLEGTVAMSGAWARSASRIGGSDGSWLAGVAGSRGIISTNSTTIQVSQTRG